MSHPPPEKSSLTHEAGAAKWRAVAIIATVAAIALLAAVAFMLANRDKGDGTRGSPLQITTASDKPVLASTLSTTTTTAPVVPAKATPEATFQAEVEALRKLLAEGNTEQAKADLAALQNRYLGTEFDLRLRDEAAAIVVAKADAILRAGQDADALKLLREMPMTYSPDSRAAKIADSTSQALLQKAKSAEVQGDLEKCAACLEALLLAFPNSAAAVNAQEWMPTVTLRLARIVAAREPERAVTLIRKTRAAPGQGLEQAAINAALADALVRLAEKNRGRKLYGDALENLREASLADPSVDPQVRKLEPEILADRILAYVADNKPMEAVAAWNDMTMRYQTSTPAHGRAQREMSPLLERIRKAGVDPTNGPAALKALALSEPKQEGARNYMEALLRSYPDSPEAVEAAKALSDHDLQEALKTSATGKEDQAQAMFQAIVTSFPKTAAAVTAAAELRKRTEAPEGMVYVPAGELNLGMTEEEIASVRQSYAVPRLKVEEIFSASRPMHKSATDAFYMDRCEVSNADYKKYMDATNRAAPLSADWNEREIKPGRENYPVTNVTWGEATAYTAFVNKRLPTEAEWEKAARDLDGRLFPWGMQFDPKRCAIAATGAKGTQPVNSLPEGAGPSGCLHLADNVQEWTQDSFAPYAGTASASAGKVVRGASWDEIFVFRTLSALRHQEAPDTRSEVIGFRCARSIK